MSKDIVMTGDRPTGRMHVGHYFGSLKARFEMQESFRCFFMIADYQALTTHAERSREIEGNVETMVMDYLAAGFCPERSICFLQSQVPQLAELTMIFSNLVSLSRLLRNPTVKNEMGEGRGPGPASLGFVGYPVSQASDILVFQPKYVPVGPDQRPHIELAREVAHRFNCMFGPVFTVPEGVYGRLVSGTDGSGKMGKTARNGLALSAPPAEVNATVGGMVTDPARVRREDPGHPEICSVFALHEALDGRDAATIAGDCREARIGCGECKVRLAEKVSALLSPMLARRARFESRPGFVRDILNLGGSEARVQAQLTLERVKEAMGMDYRRICG